MIRGENTLCEAGFFKISLLFSFKCSNGHERQRVKSFSEAEFEEKVREAGET